MAMFSAMMFRQSLAGPQFPARRWPQRSPFRTVPQEKHSSCTFNSQMTIHRKRKRSVILPLTFHIYRRGAAYTCSGFGWVALGDVCWIPLSTRPCGYRGAGEPADRCWQMDYLQGQRWSWLLPEPNWQARVNQSQPLPIQTPGVSPPKPWRCHLLPAGVKQLTVNSHIHIRDQAGCYKSRRGI